MDAYTVKVSLIGHKMELVIQKFLGHWLKYGVRSITSIRCENRYYPSGYGINLASSKGSEIR